MPEAPRDAAAASSFSSWQAARSRELARSRTDLETALRGFFIDETKFAVIEPDAKTTASMTRGTRRGTAGGELLRAVMQFKSFPIAFGRRVPGGKRWERGSAEGRGFPGVIEFAVSGMAYGYIAMTLKDLAKGKTPRSPRKGETALAAAAQSGGLGIYGDFLLGKAGRFGNDFLETLAGPLLGETGNLTKTGLLALRGEPGQARDQAIRAAVGNVPVINAWYTKAAMDWLLLDRIREGMSPGYKRRMRQSREREYGRGRLSGKFF